MSRRPNTNLQLWMSCASGLLLFACATPDRVRTTWDDDLQAGLQASSPRQPEQSAPPLHVVTPTTIGTRSNIEDPLKLANDLELSLIQFSSARRAVDQSDEPKDRWPQSMISLWQRALNQLELGFGLPPGELPKRLLIQTRVALEVELEMTQRRFGPAPELLLGRVSALYSRVALHMRASGRAGLAHRKPSNHSVHIYWPMSPIIVTSPFGYRRDPILGASQMRFHAGIDLGGRAGDVVSAAAPGQVISAGWSGGHGRTVVLQHTGGYTTVYAHLRRILVHPGEMLKVGDPLGLVGSTGRSTGPHLHFELKRGGIPIDPTELLDRHDPLASTSP